MIWLYDTPHPDVLDPKSDFEVHKCDKQICTTIRRTGPIYTMVNANAKKYPTHLSEVAGQGLS